MNLQKLIFTFYTAMAITLLPSTLDNRYIDKINTPIIRESLSLLEIYGRDSGIYAAPCNPLIPSTI